jgi:hypothetical protein
MNHLANEQSPYLLQHADNPVDWYPWGEVAFQRAKSLDRPIFLSIGYSTCHWCHVMEHESFEDEEVARLLNEYFISIKVDREERPEIDHLYMQVCQALTGRGGWPLTIFMTPDKEPFFAGTYFPKTARGSLPGLMQLLPAIVEAWNNRREDVLKSVNQIREYLQESNRKLVQPPLSESVLDDAFHHLKRQFDPVNGGFGRAPKFPAPHNLLFLLRYHHYKQDPAALDMVETTLQSMRRGGIYDHIGFGFHRYSTDPHWLVPHFEKMLYDQALLAQAYLEAFQATGKEQYARVAREIFTYVLRDMTSPEGGFYSAEDADSEGEEGKFYLWTWDEIQSALGPTEAEQFQAIFNVKTNGNFREEPAGELTGKNILHLNAELSEIARNRGQSPAALESFVDSTRQKLFQIRETRVHPFKDDKILTDWNGLMIAAFARGAVVLDSPEYLAAAQGAADFILTRLRNEEGRLWKRYRNGTAGIDAHLDDYSFVIWGLLELYEAGFDPHYLESAVNLAEVMETDFWDRSNGGFFLGSDKAESLLVRSKVGYDGAFPSGNSVAVLVLNRLSRITGNPHWAELADTTLRIFAADMEHAPTGFTGMLLGYLFNADDPKEIVIVGDHNRPATQEFLKTLRTAYVPARILLYKDSSRENSLLNSITPWTATQSSPDGAPTVYICKNFACNQPTQDLELALRLLQD